MQDRAYVVEVAGAGHAGGDYDLVAVPRGALPIASILAILNAAIQYGPQLADLIRKLVAAFTPVTPPAPTPAPGPTPTPGPIPGF